MSYFLLFVNDEERSKRFISVLNKYDVDISTNITHFDRKDTDLVALYESYGYDVRRVIHPTLLIGNEVYVNPNDISSRLRSFGYPTPRDMESEMYPTVEYSRGKKLAVLIAHRGREENLTCAVQGLMHYFDEVQPDIDFHIFIMEQEEDGQPFNKGRLFNATINEIKDDFDYFLINDADIWPILANFHYPTHSFFRLSNRNWGAALVRKDDWLAVNGFSNDYWDWGHEDIDFELRLETLGITTEKKQFIYDEIGHERNYSEERVDDNTARILPFKRSSMEDRQKVMANDGLSTTEAKIARECNLTGKITKYFIDVGTYKSKS